VAFGGLAGKATYCKGGYFTAAPYDGCT